MILYHAAELVENIFGTRTKTVKNRKKGVR